MKTICPWYAAMAARATGRASACAFPRRGAGPAHVRTSAVLRMRKSASNGVHCNAVDLDTFAAAALAGDDPDRAARDVQRCGEKFDQRLVGRAFDRRRGETDDECAIPLAAVFSFPGA